VDALVHHHHQDAVIDAVLDEVVDELVHHHHQDAVVVLMMAMIVLMALRVHLVSLELVSQVLMDEAAFLHL